MARKRRREGSPWQDAAARDAVADALVADEATPNPTTAAAAFGLVPDARAQATPAMPEPPVVEPPEPPPVAMPASIPPVPPAPGADRVSDSPETPPAPEAPPEARSFGEWLVRARERRALSIDDLAHLTKIRRAIVVSLERDARRELPEKVFVVGYVRSYAAAVGLDTEEALQRFHAAWREDEGTNGDALPGEVPESRSYGWIAPLLAAIVAIAVLWYIIMGPELP